MTIVCGTDFSENAAGAARVAAAIARRLALAVELVHVGSVPDVPGPLHDQAEELRRSFGVDVRARVESGAAAERLVALATSLGARLVVVSSLGAKKPRRWLVGSVAERVAQASPVPILVVKDGAALEAWAGGNGRALRVLVGVELAESSRAALAWAQGLAAIGRCELTVVQVVWPAQVQDRARVSAPIPLDHLRPELAEALLGDLCAWAGAEPGETSFAVKPGWGRVDSHLVQLAADHAADLVVVGTRQRAGIARLWQGSVSRGVLHGAPMSVACVPRGDNRAAGE